MANTIRLYHGGADVEKFDMSYGVNTRYGRGVYFAGTEDTASYYASLNKGVVTKYDIDISKPFDNRGPIGPSAERDALSARLKKFGATDEQLENIFNSSNSFDEIRNIIQHARHPSINVVNPEIPATTNKHFPFADVAADWVKESGYDSIVGNIRTGKEWDTQYLVFSNDNIHKITPEKGEERVKSEAKLITDDIKNSGENPTKAPNKHRNSSPKTHKVETKEHTSKPKSKPTSKSKPGEAGARVDWKDGKKKHIVSTASEVTEAGARKATKEVVEETSEKVTKEATEELIEKGVKDGLKTFKFGRIASVIGLVALGAASVADVAMDQGEKRRTEKQQQTQRRNQQRKDRQSNKYRYAGTGYEPATFDNVVQDMFGQRIGHHKMGNAKFE